MALRKRNGAGRVRDEAAAAETTRPGSSACLPATIMPNAPSKSIPFCTRRRTRRALGAGGRSRKEERKGADGRARRQAQACRAFPAVCPCLLLLRDVIPLPRRAEEKGKRGKVK